MVAPQELFGVGAASSGCITEQHNRRARTAMVPIIGGHGPEEALLCSMPPGIQNRSHRVSRPEGFHLRHRVTGGGRPPPVPTDRSVRISRTTLFRR